MLINHPIPSSTVKSMNLDSALQPSSSRVASIDILRAITMVLMIFVNDLWTLENIPVWLEHVSFEADGMRLADTIFPAFLFIVGMSIPFAIANRRKKGENMIQLLLHISSRTLALLIMGLFLVNGEYINAEATGMPHLGWYSISCISFILIWKVYPESTALWFKRVLQLIGIGTLLTLTFTYRGGEENNVTGFSIYWWGILGIIGWSYLVSAVITALSAGKYYLILCAWVLFCIISMLASADLLPKNIIIDSVPDPIRGGTFIAFALGGVLISLLIKYLTRQYKPSKMILVLLIISTGLIILGFYTRTFWGISKLRTTPAWLFICSALTIIFFVAIYWLADLRNKAHWFNFIKPAEIHYFVI